MCLELKLSTLFLNGLCVLDLLCCTHGLYEGCVLTLAQHQIKKLEAPGVDVNLPCFLFPCCLALALCSQSACVCVCVCVCVCARERLDYFL